MHPNAELITRFYTAFQGLDADGMVACYHPEIRFSDPVFPNLQGDDAGAMWRMLCARAEGFELTFSDVVANDDQGSAHWEARYRFSATGRQVHNRIDADFRFRSGLIVRHVDRFDFWRWSRMALGPAGLLLGWTPLLTGKVRAQAAQNLARFMEG